MFILTGLRGSLVSLFSALRPREFYRDLNSFLERLNLNRDKVLLVYL